MAIPFINTVVNGYVSSRGETNNTLTWMTGTLFNPASTQEDVDVFAAVELENFRSSHPSTDSKRYRFKVLTPSEELVKVIFDASFQHAPYDIIQEAERMEGSLYVPWKRASYIIIPKGIGAFLGHTYVKIAMTLVTIYASYKVGYATYDKMVHTLNGRVIPFMINHAPLVVIRAGNKILNGVDWIVENKLVILIYGFCIQRLILWAPRIPYLTDGVRSVDIVGFGFNLYQTPLTLFGSIIGASFSAAGFTWKTCHQISVFFTAVANKNTKEYLAITHDKSYAVWKRVIADMTPRRELPRGV